MDFKSQNISDRIREITPDEQNQAIDQRAIQSLEKFKAPTREQIEQRLEQLNNEWDIEKYIEVNVSSVALTGLFMGTFFSRKWLFLSGLAAGFLMHHAIKGWCPSVKVLRFFGVRTRQEIDEEIYALKILRGDFDSISADSEPSKIIESLRG
jgi:hypothetical protein